MGMGGDGDEFVQLAVSSWLIPHHGASSCVRNLVPVHLFLILHRTVT